MSDRIDADTESNYSEDSFIDNVDLERPEGDAGTAKNRPSRDYFSPSSFTSTEKETAPGLSIPRQDTIEGTRRSSFASIGSEGHPVVPATPFFSPSYYEDNDHSESSIVMFQSPPTVDGKPQATRHRRNSRDRLPSYDSVGSSGSLVRYANLPGMAQPAPAVDTPQAAGKHVSTAKSPRILPYHERRKLHRVTAPKEPAPPPSTPPVAPDPVLLPTFETPPPHPFSQSPTQLVPRGAPPGGPPSPMALPPYMPTYPMPPPPEGFVMPGHVPSHGQVPPNFQYMPPPVQYFGFPPPPPGQQPMPPYPFTPQPPRPHTWVEEISQPPVPPATRHRSSKEKRQLTPSSARSTQRSHHLLPQQPLPPMSSSLRNNSSLSSISHVSSGELESSDNRGRRGLPPPPPPLPPYVRSTSSGSISSLGSRSEDDKKAVKEYHKKGQDFLRQAEQRARVVPPLPGSPRSRKSHTMERPPASRGTHRRLPSIENDEWDDKVAGKGRGVESGAYLSSSASEDEFSGSSAGRRPNEMTRLLPPPPAGISSDEGRDKYSSYGLNGSHSLQRDEDLNTTQRRDNTSGAALLEFEVDDARRAYREKRRRKKKRRALREKGVLTEGSVSSSSYSSQDYRQLVDRKSRSLKKEREKLFRQWRREHEKEQAKRRQASWFGQCSRCLHSEFGSLMDRSYKLLAWVESFVANIPLTIGAIALASANLGVVWFKFAEENMASCQPVHFHSSQCTFPEFPGCFYCDTDAHMYKVALRFHWGCSIFAGLLASLFLAKMLVASRVVFDELSSPTTASPAGLICMTLDVVFAGHGGVGETIISASAMVHLCLVIWFIYMALAYHIMPDPSWFPNTVSIGLSAVKVWLYFPMAGHFLMAISLSLNFFFFPISVIRVAVNRKISATVGWMQMSAPNISLYALTLMAQPSFEEEHPDINSFQRVHRMVYLPCMHFFFSLCILGMVASVTSLAVRWSEFRKIPFSPAHAAFCVPTLSHANAIQAYRAAVNSFSEIPDGHPFKAVLYWYWVLVLGAGTLITIGVSTKYLSSLSAWTHVDMEGEAEPPAPYETSMTASNLIATGETMVQPFVSPAILQANETGALVLARDLEGRQYYRRTRHVAALGFEPILSSIQMDEERELLLEWVGKNPPRRRHRTLSVPGIDFSYGSDIGTGNSGVFGMENAAAGSQRRRFNTSSPYNAETLRKFFE